MKFKVHIGYVWFIEKLWENIRERTQEGKVKGKKNKEKKMDLKPTNYFYTTLQTYFTFFNSSI